MNRNQRNSPDFPQSRPRNPTSGPNTSYLRQSLRSESLDRAPQLSGYSDSDIDVESDEDRGKKVARRPSSNLVRSRQTGAQGQNNVNLAQNIARSAQNNVRPGQNNVRPAQSIANSSQSNVRPDQNVRPGQNNVRSGQYNATPARERTTLMQSAPNTRTSTSGHNSQTLRKPDTASKMVNVRKGPSSAFLAASKRPLTPNAPKSASPAKRIKRGPFDNDSSGEDDDVKETTPNPSQPPRRQLNLARLRKMVVERDQATPTKDHAPLKIDSSDEDIDVKEETPNSSKPPPRLLNPAQLKEIDYSSGSTTAKSEYHSPPQTSNTSTRQASAVGAFPTLTLKSGKGKHEENQAAANSNESNRFSQPKPRAKLFAPTKMRSSPVPHSVKPGATPGSSASTTPSVPGAASDNKGASTESKVSRPGQSTGQTLDRMKHRAATPVEGGCAPQISPSRDDTNSKSKAVTQAAPIEGLKKPRSVDASKKTSGFSVAPSTTNNKPDPTMFTKVGSADPRRVTTSDRNQPPKSQTKGNIPSNGTVPGDASLQTRASGVSDLPADSIRSSTPRTMAQKAPRDELAARSKFVDTDETPSTQAKRHNWTDGNSMAKTPQDAASSASRPQSNGLTRSSNSQSVVKGSRTGPSLPKGVPIEQGSKMHTSMTSSSPSKASTYEKPTQNTNQTASVTARNALKQTTNPTKSGDVPHKSLSSFARSVSSSGALSSSADSASAGGQEAQPGGESAENNSRTTSKGKIESNAMSKPLISSETQNGLTRKFNAASTKLEKSTSAPSEKVNAASLPKSTTKDVVSPSVPGQQRNDPSLAPKNNASTTKASTIRPSNISKTDNSTKSNVSDDSPKGHKQVAVIPGTARLATPKDLFKPLGPSSSTPPKHKTGHVNIEDRMDIDSPTPSIKNSLSVTTVPEARMRETPARPPANPYFEYTVQEKIWPANESEKSAQLIDTSTRITSLEEANGRAQHRFTFLSEEDAKYKNIHFTEHNSKRNNDDCISYLATFHPVDCPHQKSRYKIWVERHVVCAIAASIHPPQRHTAFVSTTVYVVRLFKLLDNPLHVSACDSNDEDDAHSPSSDSSSDSSSSESDNDPDKGKYNKKAHAKKRKTSHTPIRRTRPSAPAPPTRIRVHHPIPNQIPEIYTTLAHANRAARRLQIEMSHEKEPSSELAARWQKKDRRALEERICALEAEDGESGGGFWKSEFNGRGCGGDRFDLVVERTGLGGPRNV